MILNEKQANAIYDILVEECGAPEEAYDREYFVRHQTTDEISEWRFQGNLGFGGKFWNCNNRLYVNCYREDETPLRQIMIDVANKRLLDIH